MQERTYDMKQVRALAGLTQRQAAALINVHEVTYNKYEKHPGQLSLWQATILAEAAGIGVDQIKIQ